MPRIRTLAVVVKARPFASAINSRAFRLEWRIPSPMLVTIGTTDTIATDGFEVMLAEWGWKWAYSEGDCGPVELPLFVEPSGLILPQGFDARRFALAGALSIVVNNQPLLTLDEPDASIVPVDILETWKAVEALSQRDWRDALSLAFIADEGAGVFDLDRLEPDWLGDVRRVCVERAPLGRMRPLRSKPWLRDGYKILRELSDMRGIVETFEDVESLWDGLPGAPDVPAAFGLLWWWEAVYRLSERYLFDDAARADRKLADIAERMLSITGLVNPVWRFHRGRLLYYSGQLGDAASDMLRHLALRGDDTRSAPMLYRETANVLSDLGCLEAALMLADRSIEAAEERGQDSELFRSLGRRGEILLKLERLDEAMECFNRSLALQLDFTEAPDGSSQTRCYLGHAALLLGNVKSAMWHYQDAEDADTDGASAPYVAMGRLACAARTRNRDEVLRLWEQDLVMREKWLRHSTHVLPAAVCCFAAASMIETARADLPRHLAALIVANYAIEAIAVLRVPPHNVALREFERIEVLLRGWQRSLNQVVRPTCVGAAPFNAPALVAKAARRALSGAGWASYPYIALSYPLTMGLPIQLTTPQDLEHVAASVPAMRQALSKT